MFAYGTIIVFSLITLVFGGGWLVYATLDLDQLSAALQVPVGYVYTVLPLSGLLMIYYASVAIGDIRKDRDRAPKEEGGDHVRTVA